MKEFLLIHGVALALILTHCEAKAFDYDVEWPSSDGKNQTSTLVITINNCKTKITMKNSDIEKFSEPANLKAAVQIALQNEQTGCKR